MTEAERLRKLADLDARGIADALLKGSRVSNEQIRRYALSRREAIAAEMSSKRHPSWKEQDG